MFSIRLFNVVVDHTNCCGLSIVGGGEWDIVEGDWGRGGGAASTLFRSKKKCAGDTNHLLLRAIALNAAISSSQHRQTNDQSIVLRGSSSSANVHYLRRKMEGSVETKVGVVWSRC